MERCLACEAEGGLGSSRSCRSSGVQERGSAVLFTNHPFDALNAACFELVEKLRAGPLLFAPLRLCVRIYSVGWRKVRL
jgi:hypothetical protein